MLYERENYPKQSEKMIRILFSHLICRDQGPDLTLTEVTALGNIPIPLKLGLFNFLKTLIEKGKIFECHALINYKS